MVCQGAQRGNDSILLLSAFSFHRAVAVFAVFIGSFASLAFVLFFGVLAHMLAVAVVPLNALAKCVRREKIHQLEENRFSGIHERVPPSSVKELPIFAQLISNR
jgi:hypothetical protein